MINHSKRKENQNRNSFQREELAEMDQVIWILYLGLFCRRKLEGFGAKNLSSKMNKML